MSNNKLAFECHRDAALDKANGVNVQIKLVFEDPAENIAYTLRKAFPSNLGFSVVPYERKESISAPPTALQRKHEVAGGWGGPSATVEVSKPMVKVLFLESVDTDLVLGANAQFEEKGALQKMGIRLKEFITGSQKEAIIDEVLPKQTLINFVDARLLHANKEIGVSFLETSMDKESFAKIQENLKKDSAKNQYGEFMEAIATRVQKLEQDVVNGTGIASSMKMYGVVPEQSVSGLADRVGNMFGNTKPESLKSSTGPRM